VSFDRPYEAGTQGAGQFLQFEMAFLRVAERAGVRMQWTTTAPAPGNVTNPE
jgi:hypothetical protein